MYRYDEFDQAFVEERTRQFKDQVARRLSGSLSEEEFRPMRLRNGLYLQLHAYMLRIAIPYGTLNAVQMRALASIARDYDRGYGHFTTRQNIQFNWVRLAQVGEILERLASVQMHAIQTSGNCVRNVTADHFAGIAADEVADPRPVAEILRQWSSGHPEFEYLPRKFKIAVTGAEIDRAAIRAHDIGLALRQDARGVLGVAIYVGGGLGRTPVVGKLLRDFVPIEQMLGYIEAVLRVYNAEGRRDNKYKARIKILVNETGLETFAERVEAEYAASEVLTIDINAAEIARIHAYFALPDLKRKPGAAAAQAASEARDPEFARFMAKNSFAHKHPDYVALTVSLKAIGAIPGDLSAAGMDRIADLAEAYSQDEIRVTHYQNLILPHIARDQAHDVFTSLKAAGLSVDNAGDVTDIIACPGLDYCALATARSIPVAQAISTRFSNSDLRSDIGPMTINISGCINACGHHHLGNIGILGLEKAGRENYQITLGGDAGLDMALGEHLGRGVDADEVPEVVEALIEVYRTHRAASETFAETVRRVGVEPFRARFQSRFGGSHGDH